MVLLKVAGTLLLAGLMAGAGVWWLAPYGTLEVTLRAQPEGGRAVVQQVQASFALMSSKRPVQQLEVDLAPWRGKLVRIDVEGRLRKRRGFETPAGFAGYAASLVTRAGEQPLPFAGWRSERNERAHVGALGAATFQGPRRDGHDFVYGGRGHLWQVVPAREGERLRIYVSPLLEGDLQRVGEPFRPEAPKPQPAWAGAARTGGARPPDVFIYLVDTLRADHLGCYGYPRPTSPEIDRFARTATLYQQAQAAATWTRPSVASVLTGLYPFAHGVIHLQTDKLDDWPVTLAEALHEAGYHTLHISANEQVSQYYGFGQGVDRFASACGPSAAWVNRKAAEFLQEVRPEQPVFMYLQTIEPHAPYLPKPATLRLFTSPAERKGRQWVEPPTNVGREPLPAGELRCLRNRYDAEIRDNDAAFGEFLRLLARTGRDRHALIVLLADHGEAFGEHGEYAHGTSLNAEEMHVPLLIRYPEGQSAGRQVPAQVSLVDVYPTVLAATGASPRLSYALPGRDLEPLARAQGPVPERPVFSEVALDVDNRLDLVGVIDESGYKQVFDLSASPRKVSPSNALGLWHITRDPGETIDLRAQNPTRAAYGEALAAGYLETQRWWRGAASTGKTASAPVPPQLKEHLRALGYVK